MEQGCSRDVNAASFTQRRDEKAFGHPVTRSIDLPTSACDELHKRGYATPTECPTTRFFQKTLNYAGGANGQMFVAARD